MLHLRYSRYAPAEKSVLQAVLDEEFLHEKINNRDVYEDYGSTKDIPEDALRLLKI